MQDTCNLGRRNISGLKRGTSREWSLSSFQGWDNSGSQSGVRNDRVARFVPVSPGLPQASTLGLGP